MSRHTRPVWMVLLAGLAGCAGSHVTSPPDDGGGLADTGRVVDAEPLVDGPSADRMLTPEDIDAAPAIDGAVAIDARVVDAAPTPDAAPLGPCNLLADFGTAAALTGLNTASIESAPTFAPDGLTLYFSSTRPGTGGYDIYSATRAALGSPGFGAAALVSGINTTANEYTATLSSDQKTIYFISERTDGGALGMGDVWKATRASAGGTFGAPTVLGDVSSNAQETDPYLLADGSALLFASDRPGGALLDFWLAPYNSATGSFGAATRVVELSSASLDFGATMTADARTVAFTSNRAGGGGGGFDLWIATRASAGGTFSAPTPLTTINTAAGETGAALSPNGCEIVFARGSDLFYAKRP